MVLDYKDVAFSFQKRKIRRRRQRLRLALLVAAVLVLFGGYRFLRVSAAVGRVQDMLLDGRLAEAEKKISELASSFFRRDQVRELGALSDLFADRLPRAQARFDELKRQGAVAALRSGRFQKLFFDRGEYPKLKIYTDYLLERGGDENTWFYALYQAAFFNGHEAEKAVARLSPAFKKENAKALALLAKVNSSLRLGRCDYVFDRNGAVLAYFDVRRQKTHSLLPGFDFVDFDRQVKKGLSYFQLTLDAGLQLEIARLFKDFSGTLLVLELPENNILAAYSKPGTPAAANAVFSETYEPGSTVKIVSLLAYLRQADQSVFPFACPGRTVLGKRVFYDAAVHKQVKDYAAALAVSCNIAFAEMGLRTGFKGLAGMLELFRFNAPAFADWFLEFRVGAFKKKCADDFALASMAAGLDGISLTTVHAAVLAAVFSQNGLLFSPYLIDDAKSILNLGYHGHRSQPLRLLTDDLNFRRVAKALREALSVEDVPGRDAAAHAVELALRTGIAGDPRRGLDALAIGFYPFEKPRYAFAFRLEGAAKSKPDGEYFLRGLLRILRQK
jgi:hypothetical protein